MISLIAWGSVPFGAFQFDDFNNIVRDPATADLAELAARLPHGLRPLTRLSYFVDAHVFGMNAAGFLATNLALHLATVALVFALARRRLDLAGAFCAAVIFTLQPANAEVVAYVSGRSTGLMAPLLLGGLLLHERGRCAASLACFALACLAKEVALVFPALLMMWDATRREPLPGAARAALAATLLAAAIGAALLGFENHRAMLETSFELRPLLDNLLANGRAIPIMLSLWLRPWALSADHDFATNGATDAAVAGLASLISAFAVAVALRRRSPLLALALAWPLLALLPTNSIVPKLDLVTEKPLYLAWLGPSIALGAGLRALWPAPALPHARRLFMAASVALLCAAAAGCIWRVSLWRDPTRLWLDATAKAPGKARCWTNLGMAHLVTGRDAEAVSALRIAVRLDPANEIAWTNLRTALVLCGSECDGE